jgi:hypothetical protein
VFNEWETHFLSWQDLRRHPRDEHLAFKRLNQPSIQKSLQIKHIPDVLAISDHTRTTSVNASFDQVGDLRTLRVTDSSTDYFRLVNTINGTGQDDERSDLCLLVGLNNSQVYTPVECIRRQRIEKEQGGLRRWIGP